MRLHRFYIQQKIEAKAFSNENARPTESKIQFREIEITEDRIVHQVRNVFRLGVGDKVIVFDGNGTDFETEIVSVSKSNLKLRITNSKLTNMPKRELMLFMSVIKKENFELVCEKVTELGITKIVPVVTERTLEKNLNRERIEKILIEASEQCGRGSVPLIAPITNLELGITNEIKEGKEILVADMGGVPIRNLKLSIDNCAIFIGPEGGWSEEEKKLFKDRNLKIVSLGETVLRAETAAIIAVAFAL